MASKEFFLSQVERLKTNFGEHHYKSECVGFIWQETKHLSDQDLKVIVDDFIADLGFPPKRKLFREALSNKRLFRYQVEKEQRRRETLKSMPPAEQQKRLTHIYQSLFGGFANSCESIICSQTDKKPPRNDDAPF